MSAREVHMTALDLLGHGNEVGVVELLKAQTAANVTALDEAMTALASGLTDELVDEQLERLSAPNEDWLAVAYPALEHGSERLLQTVARMVTVLSESTLGREDRTNRNMIGEPVIGRLVWASSAYSLAVDGTDALAAILASPIVRFVGETRVTPLAFDLSLRHARVFGGKAGLTIDHYADWLENLELLAAVTLFDPIAPGGSFAEADLVLALAATPARAGGVYTNRLHAAAIRRLGARVSDPRQRGDLASMFAVTETELAAELNRRYHDILTAMHGELFGRMLPDAIIE